MSKYVSKYSTVLSKTELKQYLNNNTFLSFLCSFLSRFYNHNEQSIASLDTLQDEFRFVIEIFRDSRDSIYE